MPLTKRYKGQKVTKTKTVDQDHILIRLQFDNGARQWCSIREDEYNLHLTYEYEGEPANARIQETKVE